MDMNEKLYVVSMAFFIPFLASVIGGIIATLLTWLFTQTIMNFDIFMANINIFIRIGLILGIITAVWSILFLPYKEEKLKPVDRKYE